MTTTTTSPQPVIEVTIKDNSIEYIDHKGGWESRAESTIALFKEAFKSIKNIKDCKIKHFYIHMGDISKKYNDELTFGYTNADDVVLCPDFSYDRWVECGIDDYEMTARRILEKGKKGYSSQKLFWIGNLGTQSLRHVLNDLGEKNNDKLEIIPMDWIRKESRGTKHETTRYVSLEDHTQYKYLIDTGARGWSARVKFMLFSNRPLFLVDREKIKQDYIFLHLRPYEHYIPVLNDLSDLMDQLEWSEKNEDKVRMIAENAKEFAVRNLNKPEVIKYLTNQLKTNLY